MPADPDFEDLSVSVVVMLYNEVDTLAEAVDEVREAMRTLGHRHEILLIDDASTDGSARVADELAASIPEVRVLHHPENRGLGGVYRTAFREVANDIVYFMAADLQPIPGEYFRDFFPLFRDHDLVVGVDVKRQAPLLHRAFSRIEKILFALAFPGVPKVGGPLMIRRRCLQPDRLHFVAHPDRSWTVLWEMVIRAVHDGARTATRPVQRRRRATGRTRSSNWGNAVRMTRHWLQLRHIVGGGRG